MAVGRESRRIRQQYAGQIVEIAQRITGKLEAQIDAAEIERIADRAGKSDPGIAGTKIPCSGNGVPSLRSASMPPILPLPESGCPL